jgi:hypothetical protein
LEQREQLAALAQQLAELNAANPAAQQAQAEVQALRAQLAAIDHSAGGRLLRGLQAWRARLAPPGTRRDRALSKILQPFVGSQSK